VPLELYSTIYDSFIREPAKGASGIFYSLGVFSAILSFKKGGVRHCEHNACLHAHILGVAQNGVKPFCLPRHGLSHFRLNALNISRAGFGPGARQ
jgi:hypothetical protein